MVLLLVVVIVLALVLTFKKEPAEAPIVGGDRDEHGCIGSAGYTWCEAKAKCLREWEEPCGGEMPKLDRSVRCESEGGEWYETAGGVCEKNFLSEAECGAEGGIWNGCASACRHDPEAEMCTEQCVLTCSFK